VHRSRKQMTEMMMKNILHASCGFSAVVQPLYGLWRHFLSPDESEPPSCARLAMGLRVAHNAQVGPDSTSATDHITPASLSTYRVELDLIRMQFGHLCLWE